MLSKVVWEQTEKRTKSARGIKEEYTESHALKWRIVVCKLHLTFLLLVKLYFIFWEHREKY